MTYGRSLPLTIQPNGRTFSANPAPLNRDNEVFRVNVPGEQSLFLCLSLTIRIEAVNCNEDQFLCLAGKPIKKPAITSLLTTKLWFVVPTAVCPVRLSSFLTSQNSGVRKPILPPTPGQLWECTGSCTEYRETSYACPDNLAINIQQLPVTLLSRSTLYIPPDAIWVLTNQVTATMDLWADPVSTPSYGNLKRKV